MPVTTRRPTVADPKRRALTPNETATRLGLTTQQLRHLRHRGDGPTFVTLTRSSTRYRQIQCRRVGRAAHPAKRTPVSMKRSHLVSFLEHRQSNSQGALLAFMTPSPTRSPHHAHARAGGKRSQPEASPGDLSS